MTVNTKAKLFVHIGGAKCGSSAIQQFMKSNVVDLYKQGFIVPDIDMSLGGECTGEQIQYFERCKDSIDDASHYLSKNLLKLRDDYYSKNGNNRQPAIIVSAENLSCWSNFAGLFGDLSKQFEVKIVIYIRRQDDYFISFWQQWHLKENDDFWAWVLSSLKWMGDWDCTIEPWINIVGEENIKVSKFSRKCFKDGDLIADFSSILGINLETMQRNIFENPSYNDGVTALASSVRDVFDGIHDNEFYQMMADWGGSPTYKKYPSKIMTLDQRRALLFYFSDSNANIKDRFFQSESGELFEPASEKGINLDNSGSVEGRLEVLTRLIFSCYQEVAKNRTESPPSLGKLNKIFRNW